MAVSPRRSSRARTSQPTSIPQNNTNSSASSVASSRADRNARPQQKTNSQRSSVAANSQSGEDLDDSEKPQPRRTRSSQDEVKEETAPAIEDEIDDESEEDVTRCICGSQEYPGLPVTSNETPRSHTKSDPNSSLLSEDGTGWFIQCNKCNVWQHGRCVGIMDEATSPEEYFCEQCRKDLHKVSSDVNGRNYSVYLPAQEKHSEPSSPEPKSKNSARRTRDGRGTRVNAESFSKGRRATMNSRDSAYDEAEQLRRAIEESKKDSVPANATSSRKGKRSRSESEEHDGQVKRRRTTSGSSSSHSKNRQEGVGSEEEVEKESKARSIRGAAARNQKAKQERERAANREPERIETVVKRKNTIERRRGDESDGTPEPPLRTNSKSDLPSEKHLVPPALQEPTGNRGSHHKKTGRPPARRGRVGRNQYTKDRDVPGQANTARTSPARSANSPEGEGGTANGNSTRDGYPDGNGVGKPSKPRYMNPNRTTMNDMKRRVAAILEFISHTQVEMAGLDPPAGTTKDSTNTNTPSDGSGAELTKKTQKAILDLESFSEEDFSALGSVEMMEVLTRKLMRWQGEYGKWGDK